MFFGSCVIELSFIASYGDTILLTFFTNINNNTYTSKNDLGYARLCQISEEFDYNRFGLIFQFMSLWKEAFPWGYAISSHLLFLRFWVLCFYLHGEFEAPKPIWYKELFAWLMDTEMESYEKEISSYKMKLFDSLVGRAEMVLEIGIGTGPNFKYYTALPNVSIVGVDPNAKMESYARKSAAKAGLKSQDFTFIHALGESIPLEDASVDAVVGTLVLCSVTDVTRTLNEIKRVLRPGGIYLFIEHVAAEDGSFLRLVQNVLDPLQQVVADGCHLTRHTGESILEARFNGGAYIRKASLSNLAYISSHVYGVAYN